MHAAFSAIAWPFRTAHWLLYATLIVFGHVLMLVPAAALAWMLAMEEGSGLVGFVLYGVGLFMANRLMSVVAHAIEPRPRMRNRVPKAPKPEREPRRQMVSVAVGRRSAPSERAIRRGLPPELRRLVG